MNYQKLIEKVDLVIQESKMKKKKFEKLPVFDDENDLMKLKIGDSFLYGQRMIEQVSYKEVGKEISYYKIINKSDYSVEYIPIYDIIERDSKEEENKF
jgi:hypothetical protein